MATPVISGITRTNLGPLTTDTWTYSCTKVIQQCSNCNVGWQAQTCINSTVTDNQDCWPPRATNVPATSNALFGWGVYSPGYVCPGGYTSVAAATYGSTSKFNFQFPLSEGEMAIGCCPTGDYTPMMRKDGLQTCVQFAPTTSFLVGTCGAAGAVYTPFSIGEELGTKTLHSFSVSAPMLQVVYQATDLPASTSSSSAETSPSSSSENNKNNSSNLSPGAIGGIAAGATIIGLLLLTAGIIWYRRRNRAGGRGKGRGRGLASDGADVTSEYKSVPSSGLHDLFEAKGTSEWPHNHTNNAAEVHGSPEWRWNDDTTPRTLEVNPNDPAELAYRVVPVEIGSSYSPKRE